MAQVIKAATMKDRRGVLSVVDKILPFEIKRVFYLYEVNSKRGGHGHKYSTIAMIALNGSIEINIQTPCEDKKILLCNPEDVLILNPEDWHEMVNFSKGSVLLVLSSHSYDKSDYFYEPYRELK